MTKIGQLLDLKRIWINCLRDDYSTPKNTLERIFHFSAEDHSIFLTKNIIIHIRKLKSLSSMISRPELNESEWQNIWINKSIE